MDDVRILRGSRKRREDENERECECMYFRHSVVPLEIRRRISNTRALRVVPDRVRVYKAFNHQPRAPDGRFCLRISVE
jgi:hypothetical protein